MSFSYFDVTLLDGQKSRSKYTEKFQKTDANPTKSSRQRSVLKWIQFFLSEFKLAFSVYDRSGSGRINQKQMTELCRSLGHNITATDKDVIDTEFKLGGKSFKFVRCLRRRLQSQLCGKKTVRGVGREDERSSLLPSSAFFPALHFAPFFTSHPKH